MSIDPEADLYRILARCEIHDCWTWTGAFDAKSGYGKAGVGSRLDGTRRLANVHRFVYQQLVGDAGELLDHLCRNKLCVNPDHLEPVNKSINALRGHRPLATRTHCSNGHEYTPENTKPRKPYGRRCLSCERVYKSVSASCQFVQAAI